MVTIIDPALKDGANDYFVVNIHELIRLEKTIKNKINSGKAIVVGARQVGKTTLIKSILQEIDYLFLEAHDPTTRN